MLCYKDTTFCERDCNNLKCNKNKKNINVPPEYAWMPIAFTTYQDCKDYIKDKEK